MGPSSTARCPTWSWAPCCCPCASRVNPQELAGFTPPCRRAPRSSMCPQARALRAAAQLQRRAQDRQFDAVGGPASGARGGAGADSAARLTAASAPLPCLDAPGLPAADSPQQAQTQLAMRAWRCCPCRRSTLASTLMAPAVLPRRLQLGQPCQVAGPKPRLLLARGGGSPTRNTWTACPPRCPPSALPAQPADARLRG